MKEIEEVNRNIEQLQNSKNVALGKYQFLESNMSVKQGTRKDAVQTYDSDEKVSALTMLQ